MLKVASANAEVNGKVKLCRKSGCNLPVWIEPRTRIEHEYCGRTHALEASNRPVEAPHGPCHTCNLRGCNQTVFFDKIKGRVHDFCSKDHAERAIQRGEWPQPIRRERIHALSSSSSSSSCGPSPTGSTGNSVCKLAGCNLPAFECPKSGRKYDFCGRTHAIDAKTAAAAVAGRRPPSSSASTSSQAAGSASGSGSGSGSDTQTARPRVPEFFVASGYIAVEPRRPSSVFAVDSRPFHASGSSNSGQPAMPVCSSQAAGNMNSKAPQTHWQPSIAPGLTTIDRNGPTSMIIAVDSRPTNTAATSGWTSSSSTSSHLSASSSQPAGKAARLTPETDDSMRCVVCLDRLANVLLSCGHRCLCKEDAPAIKSTFNKCPLCSAPITTMTDV